MLENHDELAEELSALAWDPYGYSLVAWDWGHGWLTDVPGPRVWQGEILQDVRDHLADPDRRFMPCRISVASGHGIGKSALIGMLIDWGMSTCADCRVIVTANTEKQLLNKTWPEVTKWLRTSLTSEWFEDTATAIYSRVPGHDKSWRADAIAWSKENTEAFAGLHNKGRRIIIIFDEASAIDDRIWEVIEGAMTDADTEIIWLAFGNPTRATGRFRECFRKFKALWIRYQIDSREVEGTNLALFKEWETTYGIDSDFYKVRVRGLFPNLSFKQFIGETDVEAAYGKHLPDAAYSFAPKIIGVDPAWEGDDTLEIYMRQGLACWHLLTIAKNDDDVAVANIVARLEDDHQADAVFVDLGYGTGIVSAARAMGRTWLLVPFGGASTDPGLVNKRAEMWRDMRDWLKAGGAIPADPDLRDQLMAPETVPRLDGKLLLESKKDMKTRGVPSPNKADALAITFAFPVASKTRQHANRAARGAQHNPRA